MATRRSVATIDQPEFLNIHSISPLISKCEIKVMYVGQNRNHSFISKDVASKMAESLPGCPIVGYYIKDKKDFLDHGERIIIDGEGIKTEDMTKPYGFVAPDARIWFQTFDDTDEFGNTERREYLMAEGYLWTGQYEECKRIMEEGNPQSMKLKNDESLKGFWSNDKKTGMDFFIINDALFENLCILGDDVEPCFEGADITTPKVSARFSKNDNFTNTLFSMMNELKDLLQGGTVMQNENEIVIENTTVEAPVTENALENETVIVETPVVENETPEVPTENSLENVDNSVENEIVETEITTEEFKKDDEKEEQKENESSEENSQDKTEKEDSEENEDKKKKDEKYSLLETEFSNLQTKYSELEQEVIELRNFKAQAEDKEKDALISSFYMLSDEDKKEIIENKSKYSLHDIEAELSILCVKKKVTFDLETASKEEPTLTFNLESQQADLLPPWLKAVEANRQN